MLTAIWWGGLAAASLLVGYLLATRRAVKPHPGTDHGHRRRAR